MDRNDVPDQISTVKLDDGRRLTAVYDFERDWWTASVSGGHRSAEGHWIHRVLKELFDVPAGEVNPRWLIDVADRVPEVETRDGRRVMCRCCGYLTLRRYGYYDDCPVCAWADDPTAIFEPGERGGAGENHLSLTEGRSNYTRHGIARPWLRNRVPVRAPLPAEHRELGS